MDLLALHQMLPLPQHNVLLRYAALHYTLTSVPALSAPALACNR